MDKKQNITIPENRLDELILIGQKVRDFAAILFEDNHLKIGETLTALGAVAATFLLEFSELCDNITLDELKSRFEQVVYICLEEVIKEDDYENK